MCVVSQKRELIVSKTSCQRISRKTLFLWTVRRYSYKQQILLKPSRVGTCMKVSEKSILQVENLINKSGLSEILFRLSL